MQRFGLTIIIALAAFLVGLAVDHFVLPPPTITVAKTPTILESLGETGMSHLVRTSRATTPAAPAKSATPVTIPSVIAAIKDALALSSDRHGYMELSKLIDGLDPKDVRPVIHAVQALPNQRKKMMGRLDAFLALCRKPIRPLRSELLAGSEWQETERSLRIFLRKRGDDRLQGAFAFLAGGEFRIQAWPVRPSRSAEERTATKTIRLRSAQVPVVCA